MESRVATGAELGEENDSEEWVAYIVNAYLCFKDFDSYEKPVKLNSSSSKNAATLSNNQSKSSLETDSKLNPIAKEIKDAAKDTKEDDQLEEGSIRKTLEPIFDDDSLMQTKVSETQSKTTKRRTKSERKRQNSKS